MTSYFLFYFKKAICLIVQLALALSFFYYSSSAAIITFLLITFICLFYYYFYSKNSVIKNFKSHLVQGQDYFMLTHKIIKISKTLDIKPPKIYISDVNFFLLATYSVSKNNTQIFISNKLLNSSTNSLLEAYLLLSLSQIKTKSSHKSSFAYFITSIFLYITSKLDFVFSLIFGIHADLKYIYRSPFSSLMSVILYSFNFLFLTENTIKKSDKMSSINCSSYIIEKALWNLKHYSINTKYPLTLSSSILCVLNPLKKNNWFKYLNYQDKATARILNINGNYPIF
ncbi:MAG: hypothetical protein HAW60_04550 [Bdellovibrionales bacterium]|nr:hypothetical protein [Bdellovibrionales bacterium]